MKVTILPKEEIFLGHVGENNARELIFDISDWTNDPRIGAAGTVSIYLRQGGSTFKVNSNEYTFSDGKVNWVVGAINLQIVGRGKLELVYNVNEGEILSKSKVWLTNTLAPIDVETSDPPQIPMWSLDEIYQKIDEYIAQIPLNYVSYATAQELTDAQKATARGNIGIGSTVSPMVDFEDNDLVDLETASFSQDICRAAYEAFEATGLIVPLNLGYDGDCVRQIILIDKLSNKYGNIYKFSVLVYRPVEGDTYYLNEAERYFQLYKGYGNIYVLNMVNPEP